MTTPVPEVVAGRPCRDGECGGWAEPEIDGDYRYFECVACGHIFGWHKVPANDEPTCAVGIPESVRRAATGAAPLLQIGRRPDDLS